MKAIGCMIFVFLMMASPNLRAQESPITLERLFGKLSSGATHFLSNHQDNPRLVAIGLDLAVGVFGMHRAYLGTKLQVPVFYTFTAGGGGVLWLVDLALLIFSKDIEPFMNNPHVFMWATEEQKGHSVE
jgi:TM2 domain-containing membrane protein YozV